MTRTITVASATSGMGRTAIGINLAACLTEKGYRTCVLDTLSDTPQDTSFFGKPFGHTLDDVFSGKQKMGDIRVRRFNGIDTIAGSRQLAQTGKISADAAEHLIRSVADKTDYDFFIVISPSGFSSHVAALCLAAPELILVLPPDPGMLADSVRFLGFLALNGQPRAVKVVVNQCQQLEDANRVYSRLKAVSKKTLPEILALGLLPREPRITEAQNRGQAFYLEYPDSTAAVNVHKIATRLIQTGAPDSDGSSIEDFWVRYLALSEQPLQAPPPEDPRPVHTPGSLAAGPRTEAGVPLAGVNGALLEVLNRLTESVATASRELGAIRRLLDGGQTLPPPSRAVGFDTCGAETEKIVLDFEGFSRQKRSSQ